MRKIIYISSVALYLTACASSFYSTEKRTKNNTVQLKTSATVSNAKTTNTSTSKTSDSEGNTVRLTVSAQGKTKEEAKYNALRDALERAFGTFISSNTQILNDELIKDEIVSISSGNIEHFDIKSEVQLPDGTYSNVVDVTVSVNKLKSFCESKGIEVEFQGGLFAANIKVQKMNKLNEEVTVNNLMKTLNSLAASCFNYSLQVQEPKESSRYSNEYMVEVFVEAKFNDNINNVEKVLVSTIKGIALSEADVKTLKKQNTKIYSIFINRNQYFLRSKHTYIKLREYFERIIPYHSCKFILKNGVYAVTGAEILTGKYKRYEVSSPGRYIQLHKDLTPRLIFNSRKNYGRTVTTNYNLINGNIIDYFTYQFSKNLDDKQHYKSNSNYKSELNDHSFSNRRESTYGSSTINNNNYVTTDIYKGYGGEKIIDSKIPSVNFNDVNHIVIVFPIFNYLTLGEIEKVTQYSVKAQF